MRKPTGHRRAALILCALAALPLLAQSPRPAAASSSAAFQSTGPVKLRIWVDKASRDVTFLGRADKTIQLASSQEGVPGARMDLARIERAEFELDYDRYEVAKAVRLNDWRVATRIMQPALKGALPYLDLPENNAAEPALELGTYMLRAASRTDRTATNDVDRALARQQYEAAYEVFKACARVEWSSVGQLGVLKGCRCLLALGKPKTARFHVDQMSEPAPGDAAYGHYWLIRAELAFRDGRHRDAMDAAIKSVCFENKDVETFPDALLMSGRCYEELLEAYRARDVYYEVAKLFPRSDWAAVAVDRLRVIVASGKTREKETSPIENVFFKTADDMNALVEALFKEIEKPVVSDDDDDAPSVTRSRATPPAAPPPEEPVVEEADRK